MLLANQTDVLGNQAAGFQAFFQKFVIIIRIKTAVAAEAGMDRVGKNHVIGFRVSQYFVPAVGKDNFHPRVFQHIMVDRPETHYPGAQGDAEKIDGQHDAVGVNAAAQVEGQNAVPGDFISQAGESAYKIYTHDPMPVAFFPGNLK